MEAITQFFQKDSSSTVPIDEQTQLEKEKYEDEQAAIDEKRLSQLFEMTRHYFINEKLVGHIAVTSSVFAFGHTVEADVGLNTLLPTLYSFDSKSQLKEDEQQARSQMQKLLSHWVKRAVDSLRTRSRAYKDKDYLSGLTLAASFSLNLPAIASISINVSATVASLLVSGEMKLTATREDSINQEIRREIIKEEGK
jgi:hypothetical protein